MPFGRREDAVHRRGVDGAVAEDRRRAGGRECLEDRRRESFGDRGIRPRALGREGDALQPGQQVEGETQPRIGELGQVRVRVDHPGEQRPTAAGRWQHAMTLGRGIRGGADRCDPALLVDHEQAVGLMAGPAGRQRRQDAGADREGRRVRQIHGVRLAGPSTNTPPPHPNAESDGSAASRSAPASERSCSVAADRRATRG